MDFITIAKQRMSVRSYKETKVEPEKLKKILEAAHVAPTAANLQPVHLIAVQSEEGLAKIGKAWPGVRLYGLDISSEMLKSARATLGDAARLGEGDACAFDPVGLLGERTFNRIVLSYSLSMIPEWQAAMDHAAGLLAEGGELHIVDFGDLSGISRPFSGLLRAWLAKFHVKPRTDMADTAARIAAARGLALSSTRGPLGYYQLHVLRAQ